MCLGVRRSSEGSRCAWAASGGELSVCRAAARAWALTVRLPAPAQGADCPSGPAPRPSAASALSTELGSRPSAASPGPAFVETAGGRMWGPGSGEKHTVESGWLRQLICTPSLLGAWAELPPLPTCGSPPSLALRWALGSRRRDVDGSCHGNRSPPFAAARRSDGSPRLRGP